MILWTENVSGKITRRDLLDGTLDGIKEAMKYPEVQLKINCVPLGLEEQDLCGIAEFARKNPVHVRFIEMMPIGYGSSFAGDTGKDYEFGGTEIWKNDSI